VKKYLTFLTVVTCVLSFQIAAADELVLNGDFEIGNFTSWTQSGNLGFTGFSSGDAHSGTYAAYFGPIGSLGFISQNLTTVPGGTYDLTFWLKNGGGTPNVYQVSWGGVILSEIANSPAFAYTEVSFSNLIAPSSSTELKYGFQQNPSYFYLDDVSVRTATGVPEPSTMLLLGLGLAGLAGVRRKIQK
jgi:hypothetical protein